MCKEKRENVCLFSFSFPVHSFIPKRIQMVMRECVFDDCLVSCSLFTWHQVISFMLSLFPLASVLFRHWWTVTDWGTRPSSLPKRWWVSLLCSHTRCLTHRRKAMIVSASSSHTDSSSLFVLSRSQCVSVRESCGAGKSLSKSVPVFNTLPVITPLLTSK